MRAKMFNLKSSYAGYTLIELMIGLTVGLICILMSGQAYLWAKKERQQTRSHIELQMTARVVSNYLNRLLRQANYFGDGIGAIITNTNPPLPIAGRCPSTLMLSTFSPGLRIIPQSQGKPHCLFANQNANAYLQGDAVVSAHANSLPASLGDNAAFQVVNKRESSLIAVSPTGLEQYKPLLAVREWEYAVHYIATNPTVHCAGLSVPGLARMHLTSGKHWQSNLLFTGVEDLSFVVAEPPLLPTAAIMFVNPSLNTNWQRVTVVRYRALLRSSCAFFSKPINKQFQLFDRTVNTNDRYLRTLIGGQVYLRKYAF